jgi:hypothetical protein
MARLNEPPAAPAVSATVLAGGVGGVESVDARKSQPHLLHMTITTRECFQPLSRHAHRPKTMRTKSRPPPLARQNIPTNFDEVKRRFIRQNRELAKNNSTQSLRIRSLEIEVSRLLQTNLELREELLRARNAEHDARRQSNKEGVRGFKEEMMAKLRELSGIVEGIEEAKEDKADGILEQEERRMSVLSQMEFRERQSLADLMRDCSMPTIDENTMHTRRTLEAAEIKAIRLSDGSSNGSPDLGPPPVARFECQDPIKFDAQTAADSQKAEAQAVAEAEPEIRPQEEDLPASLSINLETRRKRKDSQPKLELRRHSILPPPSPSTSDSEATASTLRTGAKRKLADRDLDKPTKAPGKTDFTFNRKTSAELTKSADETPAEPEQVAETVETMAPVQPSARKVLGDKSVNMSPRKTVASLDKPVNDDLKKPAQPKFGAAKDRTTSRRSRLSAIPPPQSEPEVSVNTIEFPAEPALYTPAPCDIFSPTPEPSALSNERTATPPPMKLSNASVEAARPSRRARSAVNYAEPSLGAKMRRQEKGMMDAVTGLQHHRLAMSVSAEKKARSRVVVKDEPQDEDAWKSLPAVDEASLSAARSRAASPLDMKGNGTNSMDAIVRPETGRQVATEDSTSEHKAAAPVPIQPPRQRSRQSIQDKTSLPDTAGADLDDAAKKLKELDLYDFKDSSSSPASTTSTASSDQAAKPPQSAPRSHRRHSSIPKDAPRTTASDVERVRPAGRTASATSAASRRRSMMT